jgi:hypothetical protein
MDDPLEIVEATQREFFPIPVDGRRSRTNTSTRTMGSAGGLEDDVHQRCVSTTRKRAPKLEQETIF